MSLTSPPEKDVEAQQEEMPSLMGGRTSSPSRIRTKSVHGVPERVENHAGSIISDESHQIDTSNEESKPKSSFVRFLKLVRKLRYPFRLCLYILPIAVPLGIAFAVSKTLGESHEIGAVKLSGFFLWLEFLWLSLWVVDHLIWALAIGCNWICNDLSKSLPGADDYVDFLKDIKLPTTLLIWLIVAWLTQFQVICSMGPMQCPEHWVIVLRRVILASVVVAAIFLIKSFLLRLVYVDFARGYLRPRERALKKSTDSIQLICEVFDGIKDEDTAEQEAEAQKSWIERHLFKNKPEDIDLEIGLAYFEGEISDTVLDQVANNLWEGLRGAAIRLELIEEADDQKQGLRKEHLHEIIKNATFEARKKAKQKTDQDLNEENRLRQNIEDFFIDIDTNEDGYMDRDEIHAMLCRLFSDLKNVYVGTKNLSRVVSSLNWILSIVTLIVIAIIYGAFFSQAFTTHVNAIWGTITGASFAFAGVVSELFTSIFFVFAQHPYDVGDEVVLRKCDDGAQIQELKVAEMSLMHSTFHRKDEVRGVVVVHIPHSQASSLCIENISRSDREKRERQAKQAAQSNSNVNGEKKEKGVLTPVEEK